MNKRNRLMLERMTAWRPGLSRATRSHYDEQFKSDLEAMIEATRHDDPVCAVWFAVKVQGAAHVISGHVQLDVASAAGLWSEWTAQLLQAELTLAVVATPAAKRCFEILNTLFVVAHHYQTVNGREAQ